MGSGLAWASEGETMARSSGEDASGQKVVIGLIVVVILVSAGAALYGMHLRSEMPHDEEEHHRETSQETDTGATVEEVEDHMRSIGYVQ